MRSNPQKGHMWSTWLEAEESRQAVKFVTVSREGPSREVLVKLSAWQKDKLLYHILYPYYKYPHYPWIVRSALQRENPSIYTWELEIVIPTIIYIFPYGFPQLLPLYLKIPESLLAQTLSTPILSIKWDFGAIGKHWNESFIGGCNRAELWDPES